MSFSSQEKKALAGFGAILLFVAGSIYEIGKRNFWFEAKNTYLTTVADADGLRVGSAVTIAGLRVGEVSSLDVDEKNQVVVTLNVRRAVGPRIRGDSVATFSRAFVIGEKRVDILPGSADAPVLPSGATLPGRESADLMDFLSGRKLAELMAQVETMIGGMNDGLKEMDKILEKYHAGTFDKSLTMVEPALRNFLKLSDDMIVMTHEMKTRSKELPVFVESGANVFKEFDRDFLANGAAKSTLGRVDQVLAPIAERQQLVAAILDNLGDLSHDLKQDPRYGRQVLDAVQELTVTLKALQKTWFLEDQAAEAKKEVKTSE